MVFLMENQQICLCERRCSFFLFCILLLCVCYLHLRCVLVRKKEAISPQNYNETAQQLTGFGVLIIVLTGLLCWPAAVTLLLPFVDVHRFYLFIDIRKYCFIQFSILYFAIFYISLHTLRSFLLNLDVCLPQSCFNDQI